MTTSMDRFVALPSIPSARECGINLDLVAYWGLYVPKGTPQPIIDKLYASIEPTVSSDETKKFLANLGFDPWVGNGKMLGEMIERETKRWSEYIKLANIQPQ
jgi:tripartite-type tricarboxylate transporter receptor subunit TctC